MARNVHGKHIVVDKPVRWVFRPTVREALGLAGELDRNLLSIRASPRLQDESIPTSTKLRYKLILRDKVRVNQIAFGEPGGEFMSTDNRYR